MANFESGFSHWQSRVDRLQQAIHHISTLLFLEKYLQFYSRTALFFSSNTWGFGVCFLYCRVAIRQYTGSYSWIYSHAHF